MVISYQYVHTYNSSGVDSNECIQIGLASSALAKAFFDIDLATCSVKEAEDSLRSAFHDLSDAKHMYVSIVTQGDYGLHGFYEHATYILDEMRVDDPRYRSFYDLYQRVCFQAARKVSNYLKVSDRSDGYVWLLTWHQNRNKSQAKVCDQFA
jgi:hypothetical protein